MASVLEIKDLTVKYHTEENGTVTADRAVCLNAEAGRITGIIGFSGSGKTSLMLAVMGLLPKEAEIESGTVKFQGTDITVSAFPDLLAHDTFMSGIRGKDMCMIFQNPMSYFDPTVKIGAQIAEVLRNHRKCGWFESRRMAAEMLAALNVPDAKKVCRRYPIEVNGGLLQKAAIAIGLANKPKLLIADEPFSALDAENTALVCERFEELKNQGSAVIVILHDLRTAERLCDDIAVMNNGEIVEQGTAAEVMNNPQSEYTKELIEFAKETDE